ncbi:MAG: sulfatase [Candidatus Hydrogenedentota bacterium]
MKTLYRAIAQRSGEAMPLLKKSTMVSRRELLKTGVALAGAAVFGRRTARGASERSPNVVIVFTDDQGYGDVGCYGAEGYETPNLDRMAREGMQFTDFYVAAPVCTPSRAALMTGCYPKRLGLAYRVLFPYSVTGLNPEEVTLAELLKAQGYTTAIFGKWHLGHHDKFLPTRQGFDYFFGTPYSNDMNKHYYKRQAFQSPPLPLYRQEKVVERDPDQHYLTRRYTEEALGFIEAHQEKPFFLYLPHNMPHRPIMASETFEGTTDHGLYGDVIAEIDWSVGQVLDKLQELGLDEQTLVIFTSDNGPVVRSGMQLGYRSGSAGPLRGQKNTTWEGGMREPCIMRWPGKIPAGSVCKEVATTMDILPTVAMLAGAQPPSDRIIDGKNIWPLMKGAPGATSPHEAFYYYRDDRLQAVRSGPWKLHVYRPEWKNAKDHPPLLYNLREDVGETQDVAEKHPDVVARLMTLVKKAREDMGDAVTGATGENVRPVGRLDDTA